MEENPEYSMKVVGRKGEPIVNALTIDGMQRMANTLRKGKPFIPKGVWRFRTHEEADEWMMKMMTGAGSSPGFQP